jgi:hypothetical protein
MTAEQFFAKHAASGERYVVLTVLIDDQGERSAVFSTLDKAKAWVDEQPDTGAAVHIPLVIDEPDLSVARSH